MKLTFKEPIVLVVEGVVIKITDNTTIEFEIEKQTAARPAITNEKNYVTNKVSLTDNTSAKKQRVKVRLIEKATQRIYNFDSKYVASEFMGFHKTYINTMTRDNKFENERYQWYFLNNL